MRPPGSVVLALLVVLAGCGGLVGVNDAPDATPTVTPAPVPDPAAGPNARLAPGLSRAEVVAPEALLAAHRDHLLGESFRTTRLEIRTDANGTVRSRVRTVARYDGTGRYLVNRTIDGAVTERLGTTTRVEQYADSEAGYRRRVVGSEDPTYSRIGRTGSLDPAPTAVLADPTAGRQVVLAFGAVNASVVGRGDGVVTRYRLAGTGVRSREALQSLTGRSDVSGVWNVSLSATVTAGGLVESFTLRYRVETARGEERVRRTARFEAVGETVVERPAWYAVAANRTD